MTPIRIQTTVGPGHRIEVTAPELEEGRVVEVVVSPAESDRPREGQSLLEFLDSLPPGPRLFKTPEEVDEYLRRERESWD
jgi:hypothetical protein